MPVFLINDDSLDSPAGSAVGAMLWKVLRMQAAIALERHPNLGYLVNESVLECPDLGSGMAARIANLLAPHDARERGLMREVLQELSACRSEEHTSELESLIRNSYAV